MIKSKFTNCRIYDDVNQLGRAAAEQFVKLADDYIREKSTFNAALSGGTTPVVLFENLARHFATAINWGKVRFFWSDERYVPVEHPESNAGMALRHLLQPLQIPPQNIHLVPTAIADPAQAAANYEATIRQLLPEPGAPRFDLILLGLGDDGHTASLFPDTAALNAEQKLVAANWITNFSKWRITFTFPLLNSAKNIIFLVAGESKASVIYDILVNKKDYPAARINPVNGQLLWLLDAPAGSLILQK